jgi:hypothetical protein
MLILTLLACGLTTISIDESAQTEVPKATIAELILGDMGFGDFVSMDLTESSELANQGVEPGDVEDVRLTYMELEAMTPEGSDLSFFNEMRIFVEAPELDRQELAWSEDFPEGESTVVFTLEEVDLTPYAVSQSMTFDIEVDAARPEDDTVVEARFGVDVRVTGQGIRNNAQR